MNQPNPVITFLNEAEDLLAQIEEVALEMAGKEPDAEAVNQLFRAFHTIKGSGAMFGFQAVAEFTHHVETALDKVREGVLPLSPRLLDAVLAAKDLIKAMLDGTEKDERAGGTIIASLEALSLGSRNRPDVVSEQNARSWTIRFRPDPGLMAFGSDPLLLLNELRSLGPCTVVAHSDAIPPLEAIQPDQCYLRWEITLHTDSGLNAIRDVFIFVEDGSSIEIEPLHEAATHPPDSADTSQGPSQSIPPEPGTQAFSLGAGKNSAKDATIRVASGKLDRLVNLVGELVMNQSRLTQAAAGIDAPNLSAPVEEIERLVAELRDNVLGIRMMPIGTTFSRFKRLVHDLSQELGKQIDLVTEGAETELDKTVLDQLGDPLIHLIRNSIDHGIEPAEERALKGKPGRGAIRLTAVHTGSSVVVSIQDDGRGLNAHAIRAKAVEKGLIAAETALSEKEIYNLIFLPGFSTAKQVTSVSGRGVGMDVVKRQIDSLRGSINIVSRPDAGATISLTLPLTLAIIDGLLVEISRDQFIIPMSVVTENVELHRAERSRSNGRNVISVRGELIPYIDLRSVFGIQGEEPPITKIVIVWHDDQRVGLVVDRVLGSHQTVIQSLGGFYRNIEVFSGATIMGDGRVALIMDLAGVLRYTDSLCRQSQSNFALLSAPQTSAHAHSQYRM